MVKSKPKKEVGWRQVCRMEEFVRLWMDGGCTHSTYHLLCGEIMVGANSRAVLP